MKFKRLIARCLAVFVVMTSLQVQPFQANAAETLEFTNSVNGAETSVLSGDKASVWVMSYDNLQLKQFSTSTGALLNSVNVGGSAFDIAITPDGSKIYVALNAVAGIAVVNALTGVLIKTISTASTNYGIAVSPDGANVWVSNTSNVIRTISTANDSITATYTLSSGGINDLKFSPDGTYIYLADTSGSRILKYNASNFSLVATISGITTRYIAISPDGTVGYSFPYSGSNVYKFSTNPMALTDTISGFGSPSQANFTPDGQFVYVPNATSKSIIRIKVSDNTLTTVFSGLAGVPWHSTIDPSGRYLFVSSSGSPGSLLQYNLGLTYEIPMPTLSFQPLYTFRSTATISILTSSGTGKVTFYARGKYIPTCRNIPVATTTTTCTFKPTGRGSIQITAVYSINSSKVQVSASMNVGNRSSTR